MIYCALIVPVALAVSDHAPESFWAINVATSNSFKVLGARVSDGRTRALLGRPAESIIDGSFSAERRGVPSRSLLGANFIARLRLRDSDGVDRSLSSSPLDDFSDRTPSGVPLAAESLWRVLDGRTFAYFGMKCETGTARIVLSGTRDEKGFYKPPVHDWSADLQLMERFLRYSLARIAGRRLGSVTTGMLAGASIPTATCERSNAKFGDLRAWCSAKSWTVTENKALGVLTVKRGSTFAVIPMGTAWVKWDGATWTKMSDVVMEKDGRVMAPKDVLDRLNSL